MHVGADATAWPDIPPEDRVLELEAAWRIQHPSMYGKYMAEQHRGQRHKASHAIRLVYEVNEGREHYNAAELR